MIIMNGAHVDAVGHNGSTALIATARKGHLAVLEVRI